jgi:hypothetical protein
MRSAVDLKHMQRGVKYRLDHSYAHAPQAQEALGNVRWRLDDWVLGELNDSDHVFSKRGRASLHLPVGLPLLLGLTVHHSAARWPGKDEI